MKLSTWNINGVRAREVDVAAFLTEHAPDVLCLQETKIPCDQFPHEKLQALGYDALCWGEKSFNGVALLHKPNVSFSHVVRGLLDDAGEAQAVGGCRAIGGLVGIQGQTYWLQNVYCPMGEAVGSEKFVLKETFYTALARHLNIIQKQHDVPVLVCGDFNIAPNPIDIHNPEKFGQDLPTTPQEQSWMQALKTQCGLVDVYRQWHPEEADVFTWWDYRTYKYRPKAGWRIDYWLVSESAVPNVKAITHHKHMRQTERPSDHVPVEMEM